MALVAVAEELQLLVKQLILNHQDHMAVLEVMEELLPLVDLVLQEQVEAVEDVILEIIVPLILALEVLVEAVLV